MTMRQTFAEDIMKSNLNESMLSESHLLEGYNKKEEEYDELLSAS